MLVDRDVACISDSNGLEELSSISSVWRTQLARLTQGTQEDRLSVRCLKSLARNHGVDFKVDHGRRESEADELKEVRRQRVDSEETLATLRAICKRGILGLLGSWV